MQTSSIPPVPSVSFVAPGTTQPWPRSDACWSPARPPIGGAPGRAVASATTPAESTIAGSTSGGIRSASSTAGSQPDPSASEQAGHGGVAGIGDVGGAAGQRPGQPGVDRPEGQLAGRGPAPVGVGHVEEEGELGGRGVGGEVQPLGLEGQAHADGAEVLPADAGPDRARRCGGPTGSSTPAGW